MALEKLIECICRHDLGDHDDHGCRGRTAVSDCACLCRMRPHDVVDAFIAAEVEAGRRRWLSDGQFDER
jgi:hypothetical protein